MNPKSDNKHMKGLRQFALANNLRRSDIAKILYSSIHSVNAWFSGSRVMPKAKWNLLVSHINKNNKKNESTPVIPYTDKIAMLEDEVKFLRQSLSELIKGNLNVEKVIINGEEYVPLELEVHPDKAVDEYMQKLIKSRFFKSYKGMKVVIINDKEYVPKNQPKENKNKEIADGVNYCMKEILKTKAFRSRTPPKSE